MTDGSERRQFPRLDVIWPVNILVDDEIISGETSDISAEGLHINCDDPVPMNEPVKLTIAPPGKDLINVTAKVLWSDLDGIDTENRAVGMGLCFVEISDEDRVYFEKAVSENME